MIAISGANGFLGAQTTCAFLNAGYTVKAFVRENQQAQMLNIIQLNCKPSLHSKIRIIPGELQYPLNQWKQMLAGSKYFMHIAADMDFSTKSDDIAEKILLNTSKLLNAANESGIEKMVFTASTFTIDNDRNPINEEGWAKEDSLFGYTKGKLLSEKFATEFRKTHPLKVTSIVPSVILGPTTLLNPQSTIEFILDFMRGRMLNPPITIPIVDIRNLAELYVKCAQSSTVDNTRIYANTGVISLPEISKLIKNEFPMMNINMESISCENFDLIARHAPYYKQHRWLSDLGGKKMIVDNSKFKKVGLNLYSPHQTIIDAVRCYIQKGFI